MNSLLHWLTAPEWALIVKALLHSLWQGALIAGVLALLLRRVAHPAARYRLALAGLGAVMAATLVTWGLLNAPMTPAGAVAPAPVLASVEPAAAVGSVERIVVTATRTPAQPPTQWTAWLALAWLLGTGVMLGRASVKIAGAEQLRCSCQPLNDPRITELLADARRAVKLTRQIRVAVTNQLTSPAVVGVLVPTLILPLSLITTLSPEQLRFILLHELAHIRRGDYLANLFQLFAEALLFFNPAVWWLSHQIRREREACCDALAIELSGAPADYARTLVSVAETILQPAPAAAPAFGNDREPSSLADRVQRVLVPGYRPSLRLTWRAMIAALVAGGVLLGLLAIGTRQTVAAALGNARSNKTRLLDPTNVSFPYIRVGLKEDFLIVEESALRQHLPKATDPLRPWVLDAAELARLQPLLIRAGAKSFCSAEPMSTEIVSGMDCRWRIGGTNRTNNLMNLMNYLTAPVIIEGRTNLRIVGVDVDSIADAKGWTPMEIGVRPRTETAGISCVLNVEIGKATQQATVTIPSGGGLVWATPEGTTDQGLRQLIVLRNDTQPDGPADRSQPIPAETNKITSASKTSTISLAEPFLSSPKPEATSRANAQTNPAITINPATGLPEGDGTNLFNRTFKISAPELARLTGNVGPAMATNRLESARAFFAQAGVDVTAPGRAMFFKPTLGWLFVRGTLAELDTVEAILAGKTNPASTAKPQPNPGGATAAKLPNADTNLFTRTFKVDPYSFFTGLENVGGLKATNVHDRIRAFFTSVGADLEPPKAVYFNDRQGSLLVRATQADLDIIEQAVQVLTAQAPQVNIRAQFVEVPMNNQMGKLLENLLPAATNVLTGGNVRQMLTNGFTGILTDSQAKAVLKALEQTKSVEILTAPDVTTLSGRQAQIQIVDIRTIVTGVTSIITNGVTTNGFQTSALPFGPVLDVIPYVAADGHTVQMTIIASVTEFLGYDRPDATLTEYAQTNSLSAAMPLPRYRVGQLTTSAVVWDGQTIVLGELFSSETVTPQSDGSEIRKPDSKVEKKNLLIFITPTIIDPAGNRVNVPADGIPHGP